MQGRRITVALGLAATAALVLSLAASATIPVLKIATDPGGIRSSPLPSAEIDGAGRVFVTWEDCRFRVGCSTNDLVYVTSSDGIHWSAVQRIPIDSVTSTVDHFLPGIGVDKATSGATAHVSVTYY